MSVHASAMAALADWQGEVFVTNYESIRDGRLDPKRFVGISLDEAAILRHLGTKTFQQFQSACRGIPYRFVATATPAPNEYDELLNYADFLGVMDKGQALTRFFKRNSTKAGDLTLMDHRADEFWAWVSTWAVFVQAPSDLGYSDVGYDLPDLDVRWHEIGADALANLTFEHQGQGILVADGKLGVIGASAVKRSTLEDRVAKAAELVAESPDDHFILWHHTEAERAAIKRAIPEAVEVFGNLDLDERERRVIEFADGGSRILATKPVLSGSGCNFQRHCHRAIFVGIDFKFADFIQAIHRIHRFGQTERVRIDIIHADTERQVVGTLRRRWAQHEELTARMSELIQEHGLNAEAMSAKLARSIGTERVAATGEGWEIVHDDTVRETRRMESESVDLIITSPPYGTQYEYVAAVEDFGHNDDNDAFWAQMDHLTPELLRVLRPGRMCIFHTKDRVVFGNVTGEAVATIQPFGAEAIFHMRRHGFLFLGEITLSTDVVRENNQTYRLSWSEVVKDSTKLGVGVAEKILLFRKRTPTSRAATPTCRSSTRKTTTRSPAGRSTPRRCGGRAETGSSRPRSSKGCPWHRSGRCLRRRAGSASTTTRLTSSSATTTPPVDACPRRSPCSTSTRTATPPRRSGRTLTVCTGLTRSRRSEAQNCMSARSRSTSSTGSSTAGRTPAILCSTRSAD